MGNIVETSTRASRDRAFYSPPQPQIFNVEHAEACRGLPPRLDCMLNKFCEFHCWVQWGREDNYSVSTIGHVVCLVVLPGFDLMPW